MEAFNLLKFWRNAGNAVISDVNIDCKKSDDVETDDGDSFFELVFESPKDVFRDKKVTKPQSPIALLKSAPKFRVFMLGLKKSKMEKIERNGDLTATPKRKQFQNKKCSESGRNKRISVKFKVEELPAVSSFSRDNSLRSILHREGFDDFSMDNTSSKRLTPKYLKLIKPLYERASKKYSEKTRFSDQFSANSPMSSPATAPFSSPRKMTEEKTVNRAASLKVVYKHLGKSRSTSSAVRVTPSPVNRRDDSLLQQNDGIQSAILHCKRSYSSTANDESWLNVSRGCVEELKRCSI